MTGGRLEVDLEKL